jgi:hypothetical protein
MPERSNFSANEEVPSMIESPEIRRPKALGFLDAVQFTEEIKTDKQEKPSPDQPWEILS